MHPDEGYKNFTVLYKELSESLLNLNEANTRAKIIDRFLKECLGWPESAITREDRNDVGYTDYQLIMSNRTQIIIEAKKTGEYFEIPPAQYRRHFKVGGVLQSIPNLTSALNQARNYSVDIGCKYAAIFNGHQLVIFSAITIGKSWKEGYCVVFHSLEDFKMNFALIWNILSYDSIRSGSLVSYVDFVKSDLVFQKLIQGIHNRDQTYARNDLYTYLQPISNFIFSELLDEARTEVLKQCYVFDRSNSQLGDEFNVFFTDRLPHFSQKFKIKEILEREKKGGVFEREFLSKKQNQNRNRKGSLMVLLGGIGSGKTTFIHRFFKIVLADHENLLWFYVDFRYTSPSPDVIQAYILEKISQEWDEKYSQLLSPLLSDIGFAVNEPDKKVYFSKLFNLLNRLGFSISLIIDNVDQHDINIQERIFMEEIHLTVIFKTVTIMSLREETFLTSTKTGVFDAYDIPKFHISSPNFISVINSRLDFAIKVIPTEFNFSPDVASKLIKYFKIIKSSLILGNPQSERLINFMESISVGDIREALRMFNYFTVSGNTDVTEIFKIFDDTGAYQIAYHQFIKSIILGERRYYVQDKSQLMNVFDFDTSITDSHFTQLRILQYLKNRQNKSSKSRIGRGFVDINELINSTEEISIPRPVVIDSLSRLAYFRLIELDNQSKTNIDEASFVRITPAGIYYVNSELISDFTYLDTIFVDTPISDIVVFDNLKPLIDVIELIKRIERTETFINYLVQAEESEYSSRPEYNGHELTQRRFAAEIREKFLTQKEYILSRV